VINLYKEATYDVGGRRETELRKEEEGASVYLSISDWS